MYFQEAYFRFKDTGICETFGGVYICHFISLLYSLVNLQLKVVVNSSHLSYQALGGFRGNTEKKLLPVQHNLWNLHKSQILLQTAEYPFTLGRGSAEGPSIYWWDKMALGCSSRQYWLGFLSNCVAVALLSACHFLSINLWVFFH